MRRTASACELAGLAPTCQSAAVGELKAIKHGDARCVARVEMQLNRIHPRRIANSVIAHAAAVAAAFRERRGCSLAKPELELPVNVQLEVVAALKLLRLASP